MVSVSVLSNLYKIRYPIMNNTFKYLPETKLKRRYLMVIDIGKIISTILKIIASKDIIITNKIKAQVIIAILNIIAHYRHYFYDVLKGANSFVLYCENPDHYDDYEEIINDIYNISKFIPSIIVIPKMKGKVSRYFYLHTVNYIIDFNNRISRRNMKEMYTIVYGNNPAEYQFINSTDKIYFISNNCDMKIRTFENVWETVLDKDARFHNVKYKFELKNLILPYMIYFRKFTNEKYPISYTSHSKYTTRINMIFDYIDNFRNPKEDFYISFGKNIEVSKEDITNCGKFLNELLYINNMQIKPIIAEFIKSISTKLHDKKMDNINEYDSFLNQNNINILWLREDTGI